MTGAILVSIGLLTCCSLTQAQQNQSDPNKLYDAVKSRDTIALREIRDNLGHYLESPAESVREAAVFSVAQLEPTDSSIAVMIDYYGKETSPKVRSWMVRALSPSAGKRIEVDRLLVSVIQPPYEEEDLFAAITCARTYVSGAQEPLLAMAENGSIDYKIPALEGLAKFYGVPADFNEKLKRIKIEAEEETKRATLLLSNMDDAQRSDALSKLPSNRVSVLASSGQFDHGPLRPSDEPQDGAPTKSAERNSSLPGGGALPPKKDRSAVQAQESQPLKQSSNRVPLVACILVLGCAIAFILYKRPKGK